MLGPDSGRDAREAGHRTVRLGVKDRSLIHEELFGCDKGSNLWTMNADGTGVVRVMNDGSVPSFSPDGKQIAYVGRYFYPGQPGVTDPVIYRMNADGSGRTQLTAGCGSVKRPRWSADGSKILFFAHCTSDNINPGLYVIDANRTTPVKRST